MSLLSTLIGSMSTDESAEAISRKTGVSKSLTSSLVAAALPLLFKKLTSNASSQQGAASLLGALAQHTDTASVASQIANADTADGNAIIGHILGSDQAATVSQLAAQTNLSEEQVSSVLGNIAPALMSSLSAANTENVQRPCSRWKKKNRRPAAVWDRFSAASSAAARLRAVRVPSSARSSEARRKRKKRRKRPRSTAARF